MRAGGQAVRTEIRYEHQTRSNVTWIRPARLRRFERSLDWMLGLAVAGFVFQVSRLALGL
jgi:hypothetical protein